MFFGRGKNKIQNVLNLSDMYEDYIKDKEEPYDVDQKTFVKICDIYYKECVDKVLDGEELPLSASIGKVQIHKRKRGGMGTNRRFIDWKTTVETGKVVYHLNEHSNGYNYSIDWIKPRNVHNISLYNFAAARGFKRRLVKIIKNRENDYFERRNKN